MANARCPRGENRFREDAFLKRIERTSEITTSLLPQSNSLQRDPLRAIRLSVCQCRDGRPSATGTRGPQWMPSRSHGWRTAGRVSEMRAPRSRAIYAGPACSPRDAFDRRAGAGVELLGHAAGEEGFATGFGGLLNG